jgi:hypothetical protein
VVVVNVNDAPLLEAPVGPLDTFALGSTTTGDDGGDGESGVLFIVGFALSDLDRDVDPVKVLVTCSYGFLDLNPDGLSGVDFNS